MSVRAGADEPRVLAGESMDGGPRRGGISGQICHREFKSAGVDSPLSLLSRRKTLVMGML